MDVKQAKNIFQENFFGKEEVQLVYGDVFYFDDASYEIIPLTKETATFLKQKGYALVFAPKEKDGSYLSIHSVARAFLERNAKPLIFDLYDEYKWYNKDPSSFMFKELLFPGWCLYKTSIIKGSYFSLYSKQGELVKEEVASLKLFIEEDKKINSKSRFDDINPRPLAVDEIFYQGITALLFKNFDPTRYVWTKSQFEDQYVRVGRYSDEGVEITKRDVYDGNSMTGVSVIFKL